MRATGGKRVGATGASWPLRRLEIPLDLGIGNFPIPARLFSQGSHARVTTEELNSGPKSVKPMRTGPNSIMRSRASAVPSLSPRPA